MAAKRHDSGQKRPGQPKYQAPNALEVKNRSHPYISFLLKPRREPSRFAQTPPAKINDLKAESPAIVQNVLRFIREIPTAQKQCLGTMFPQSYSDFEPRMPTPPAENLADEINWTAAVIAQYPNVINDFLALTTRFASCLLTGKLEDAENAFNATNAAVGFSLWSIETGTVLAELKGGIEENRTFFTGVRTASNDVYAQLIAEFASNRAETHLSINAFHADFAAYISDLEVKESDSEVLAYLKVKGMPTDFSPLDDKTICFLLCLESSYSLVDRYLLLLKISQHLVATRPRQECATLLSEIRNWMQHIHDLRISRINEYLSLEPAVPQTASIPPHILNELIDNYILGNYALTLSSSTRLLLQYPLSFELYEIHCKSACLLKSDLANPLPTNSVSASLLNHVNNIIRRTPLNDESLDAIEKWASILHWLPFGPQLLSFHSQHMYRRRKFSPVALRELNSSTATLRFSTAYKSRDDAISFIKNCSTLSASPSLDCVLRLSLGVSKQCCNYNREWGNVPRARRKRYEAMSSAESGDITVADEIFTELLLQNPDTITVVDCLLGRFQCLLRSKKLVDCANLVIQTFFNSRELLSHIPFSDLLTAYEIEGSDDLDSSIVWPVLYHIYFVEGDIPRNDKRLRILTDNFLMQIDCDKPSELLSRGYCLDLRVFVYFLRHICVPDVIDKLFAFECTDDVEVERMTICQQLRDLDLTLKQEYTNEISRIATGRFIREAVHSVDSSKIYVDVNGIKRSIDRAYIERFDRFRTLHGLDSRIRESIMEVTSLKGKRVAVRETVVIVDGVVQMFNDLFLDLADKYVMSSAFGLDSYLSLRIRHGTLAGQVRALFERRHLVTTSEEATGKYHANDYWREKLGPVTDVDLVKFDSVFADFSRKVDELISQVNTKWMQLTSDERPDGLFDFRYNDRDLGLVYSLLGECECLEDFVVGALDELKRRTEGNLRNVRSAIGGKLRDSFIAALNKLESEVDSASWKRLQEFSTAIAHCRTNVQVELDLISSWFETIGDCPVQGFTLRQLIDTVTEVIRRSHASPLTEFTMLSVADLTCSGQIFTPLVDVLVNVMDNAVAHGKNASSAIRVSAVVHECKVVLNITNCFSGIGFDQAKVLVAELRNRIVEPSVSSGMHTEGGTGYYKLGKLCAVDLKDVNLDIVPSILTENDNLYFCVEVSWHAGALENANCDN